MPLVLVDGRVVDAHAGVWHQRPLAFDGRGQIAVDSAGGRPHDAAGLWLCPAPIDAHVHAVFAGEPAEVAERLRASGVAAILDLGAPAARVAELLALPLGVRLAGPLLTAPGGYPTASWGRDGYGRAVATQDEARAAVAEVAALGATFVKLALDPRYPLLDDACAAAAADEAHRRGLTVAAHALDADSVRRALRAGCDVLAHTPVEELPDALVDELGARRVWVLSTLAAFGGSDAQLDNLRRLRRAGARIAYGTDLGNEGTAPGVSLREIQLLRGAGFSDAEVVAAMTSAPAGLLDLPLGLLRPGFEASVVALREDPLEDATALCRPAWVALRGAKRDEGGRG